MGPKIQPLEQRFWSKVNKSKSCWLWIGPKNNAGYGMITIKARRPRCTWYAHRIAWELTNGPIPDQSPRLCICHRCDNPSCVNPEHLFLGTDRDNVLDAFAKGRRLKNRRPKSTRFTPEQIKEIRRAYVPYKMGCREIGEIFGASQIIIWRIVTRRIYAYVE